MAMRREDAIMKTIRYLILILLVLSVTTDAMAERIKDIATFSGVRGNDLVGFGVVVGLHGTGDRGGTFTTQAVANMLTRMGISVAPEDIEGQIRNAATVIVTARLPTMIKPGSKLDVQVSSIGDARSLQGGVLLMTPLKGPDNVVYAVAQGPVSIGGFVGGAPGAHVVKNHPNVGRIPNGAIVEREVPVHLNAKNRLNLLLRMQDITTAMRIADSINERLVGNFARPESPSVVSVIVPDQFRGRVVELMAEIELLRVDVDRVARVVINERTGTVVIGENVTIDPIAIAHGGLTIEISVEYEVIHPPPFAPEPGVTVVIPKIEVVAEEIMAPLFEVRGATVGELVKALNVLGVTPRDLVAILQAIKASGSLHAELVIM